jgi:pyridoxal phosphate enzyme (YggS family)
VLGENIARLDERIAEACARAGRERREITLVAVTKKFPAEAIHEAYRHGLRDFGENYVQEFEQKAPQVAGLADARFHFIGHLQANKTRKAAELFQVVETVDSAKIVRRLDEAGRQLEIYLEVKLSGEESKSGAAPDDLPQLIEAVKDCPNLELRGLMTMPPWSENPESSRPYFARLRELARLHGLSGLSMGMSNDFEAAIEEGATLIRVGTALFGKRPKP